MIDALVSLMPVATWRNERRPVVQIGYPFFFVADEECFVTQMPAWAAADAVHYPGPFIGGRFPTHVWPRSLNISWEWADLDQPFRMRRGQPACYLQAEPDRPDRAVRLVAGRMSTELAEYRSRIEDVVKYTSGSFELIPEVARYRPTTLLSEVPS